MLLSQKDNTVIFLCVKRIRLSLLNVHYNQFNTTGFKKCAEEDDYNIIKSVNSIFFLFSNPGVFILGW